MRLGDCSSLCTGGQLHSLCLGFTLEQGARDPNCFCLLFGGAQKPSSCALSAPELSVPLRGCPMGKPLWFLLVGFWQSGVFLSSASRVLPNVVCIDWWKNFPVGLGVCLVVESTPSMHAALGAVLSPMKCKVKSNKLCAQDAFHVSMCVLTHVQGSGQPTDQKATKGSLMASWL